MNRSLLSGARVAHWLRCAGLLAATSVALTGCMGSDDPEPPADMHIPASTRVQDLIPDPAAPRSLQFTHSRHYALRASSTAALLTSVPTVRVEAQATTLKGTADEPVWSFGLGRDDLEVKLGNSTIKQAETGLAVYYSRLLGQTDTQNALRTMVQSYPQWAAVDTRSASDLQGLRIDSISLSSGERSDEDSNGSYESAQTRVTVTMTLPAVQLPTPGNPLPGCSRLLADTGSVASYVAQSNAVFVPPGAAQWNYQMSLTAHFYVADQALLYGGVMEPGKGYLTKKQVTAAAENLALFSQLIANIQTLDIPSSDLLVSFVATPELSRQTLGLISGMARAASDADCLRDVDAWVATPSLVHAGLTPAHLQGMAPPNAMLQTYSAVMDAADGVTGEYGTTCLHNSAGQVLQVGDTLACATSSGALELEPLVSAAAGVPQGFSVVTPYQRIALRAATAGQCAATSEGLVQGINHVGIGDFMWNCTNSKYAVCTGRFGRGNRICMSEWVVHNQVGDYWNIHWYQDGWKAAKQSAIKAGAFVLRAVVSYYMGGRSWDGPIQEMLNWGANVIDNASSSNTKIAGYSFKGMAAATSVVHEFNEKFKDLGIELKKAGIKFDFATVVDMGAQIVEVEVTGWQDYSNGSHCVCHFQFSDPNYCK